MSSTKRTPTERGHAISGFFVFCLLCLFAVLSATLTLAGTRAYDAVHTSAEKSSGELISLTYIVNKLHALDAADAVYLMEADGAQVLCLAETVEGETYETRIYCCEGEIREYFCLANDAFDPALGSMVAQAEALDIRFENSRLLQVSLRYQDGETASSHVALRAGEAVTP